MFSSHHLNGIRRNLALWPIRTFFSSLLFFVPIWYSFETQFLSPSSLNILYGFTTLITIILELPTGAFADLFGRRNSAFLGYLLQGLSFVFISQSQDASWLWIGYSFNAIGVSLSSGADEALIFDSLKELNREAEFSKLASKNALIFRIGLIIATFSGGYIYTLNPRLTYLLVGLVTIIGGLLTLLFTEPQIDSEKFTLKNYLRQTKDGVKELFKNQEQKIYTIFMVFTSGLLWYHMYYLYLAYADSVGFSSIQKSVILSIIYIVNGVIIYWLSSKRQVLSPQIVVPFFPILMVLGFGLGFTTSPVVAIIALYIINFVSMARFSFLNYYANVEYSSKYRATAISTLNMLISLVFVVLSFVSGKILENYGANYLMLMIAILSFVICAPLAFHFVKISKKLNPSSQSK